MKLVNKICIVIIFCLILLLFYRIVQSRTIISVQSSNLDNSDNFDIMRKKGSDGNAEGFESKRGNLNISSTSTVNLPLLEYVIMSSWNSALNEKQLVSLDALENTIKRGYRFLDMELYLVDGKVQIGFSSEKSNNSMESEPVPFFDACKLIMATAFVTGNKKDPLFLHLRIKSDHEDIYPKIAQTMKGQLSNFLYSGMITEDTLLEDVQSKIIIVVDRSYVPTISKYKCKGSCTDDILAYINIFSNSSTLHSSKIYNKLNENKKPLKITNEESMETNVNKLQMITHGLGEFYNAKNEENYYQLVLGYKVQIIPHKVFSRDQALADYETFFMDNGKHAFIPMIIAHDYLKNRF